MAYSVNFNDDEKLAKAIGQIFLGLFAMCEGDTDKLKKVLENPPKRCECIVEDEGFFKVREDVAKSTMDFYKSIWKEHKEAKNGIQRNI